MAVRTFRGGVAVIAVAAACSLASGAGAAPEAPEDAAQGALRLDWRTDLGRDLGRSLAVAQGRVAVATREHHCALLELKDGRVLWRARRGSGISAGVTLAGERVLGVSDPPEGELFCLDSRDGSELWRVRFGEAWGAPLVRDSLVYAASVSGEVRCLSLEDGRTRWTHESSAPIRSPLALADRLLLVPTQADTLIALDAATGEVRWGLAPGGALYGPPVVSGETAWCVSYAGWVTALDLRSGRWVRRTRCEGLFRTGPVGPDPLLALSSGGRLYALDPDSLRVRWHVDLEGIAEVAPAILGELVWVGLQDGSVRALRRSDGREIFDLRVPAPVAAPIVPRGDAVLISAGRGELITYRWFGSWRNRSGTPGGSRSTLREGARFTPGRRSESAMAGPTYAPIGWSGLPGPVAMGWASRSAAPGDPRRSRDGGPARWAFTAGWVLGSGLALWLQDEADQEYDLYLHRGAPEVRERAWDRAERYDRAVVASWVVSEAFFLLAARAWLEVARGGGR